MLIWPRSLYYRLPRDFRQRILLKRRARLWKRTGIICIHIPKTAGTSINHALYGRFMGHVRASDIDRLGSSELKSLPRFAVTRNPWDRLVSAYRFARRGRGVGGAHQAWVWRPERYRVPECDTFERFVKEWLAPRDIATLDGIFQPQSLFLCDDEGNLLVHHVGHFEDLGPTYEFLSQRLGTAPPIQQANRSGDFVDYRTYYTPALIEMVGAIYKEDAKRFGYTFEGPVRA